MIQKRWLVCIVAAMSLLCGCSTKESNILPPASVQQETGAEDEAMKEPEAGDAAGQQESQMSEETDEPEAGAHNESDMPKTKEAFPEITVIDTLPAVDETVPRELTPLPSSKIFNILAWEEEKQPVRQQDGTISHQERTVIHAVCHDHDVSFSIPDGGQTGLMGSGVRVEYIGEREREVLRELDDKNVAGDDCEEFNEGMAKTRQLIADGFLQDAFARYLSNFPELELENKKLTLELRSAARTDRMEDSTSWWELDYELYVELADGSRQFIATMDITKVFLVQGEENLWNDAQYRIWGYPNLMWELLEQPEEDMGEAMFTVLPEGTFTDEASICAFMERFAAERQITWECTEGIRENSIWYEYLVWKGDGGGYQYQMAVPIMKEGAGSWLIQAKIKTGAESPEACRNALTVFMETFHANPYCYRVKRGDTLSDIARIYLGRDDRYPLLAEVNGLANPDLVYAGQWIEVPLK